MTHDAEHTPSPQSVVVPVAVLNEAAGVLDCEGYGPLSMSLLSCLAAPAPSSLAGGEVQWGWRVRSKPGKFSGDRPWHWQIDEPTGITAENCEYEPVYASLLAALSPEAPAREGAARYRHKKRGTDYTLIGVGRAQGELHDDDPVVLYRGDDGGLWARHQVEFCDGRFEELPALTPRHEAPADPCASHRSMGFHIDPCCPHCEAPAEGAGEVESIARLMCRQHYGDRGYSTPGILNVVESDWPAWKEKAEEVIALRARSSAPEAREGEVVGPDSFSAEGKFFLAVDYLTLMTWRWGESCGIDSVGWDDTGDSYNQSCRDDHRKARRAVVDAFHAAVAEKIASHPAAPSADKLRTGAMHTTLMERIHEDLIRQHPDAFTEDGDIERIIPSGCTPQSAFVKIDVSALADVALATLKAEGA